MSNQPKTWNYNIWFKLCLSFICFILLFIFHSQTFQLHAKSSNSSTESNEGLHIKTKVGYDNKYIGGKPNLVQFTISNYYDRDIKGELVLQIVNDSGREMVHIVPVEVAKGNTIETQLTAEGKFTLTGNKLEFYENGFEKGKRLPFTGFSNIVGQSITDRVVFGVVANDPDTLNFVSLLQNSGYPTTSIMLDDNFHAKSSSDLSIFSILAINDVDTSQWSEEKVNAIKDWVVAGGTLIISGGASYAQTSAAFADIVPVSSSTSTTLLNTSDIAKFAGTTEQLSPIIVNNGQLQHGEILLEVDSIPIIASHDLGMGHVFYYAFDVGLKPFSTWIGNSYLLLNSLDQALSATYHGNSGDNIKRSLNEATQYFPRLKSPEISVLLLIFFVYIVIVAPCLYFIMKKFDRREWLWWMIPATAVITTVAILIVGSIGKGQLYIHKVNIAKVYDDKLVTDSAIRVFFPSGKDVVLPLDHASNISLRNDRYQYIQEPTNTFEQIIYHNHDQSKLEFRNNTYRTTKGIFISNVVQSVEQKGKVDVVIHEIDGKVTITVTNLTNEPLEHITFISGTSVYGLNNMAPGEVQDYVLPANFENNLTTNVAVNFRHNTYGHQVAQLKGWQWDDYRREMALINDPNHLNSNHFIIAFSYNDEQPKFNVKSDEMTMWMVDIQDDILQLDVLGKSISARNATIVSSSGHYSLLHNQLFELGHGTLQFEYFVSHTDIIAGQQAEIISDIFQQYRSHSKVIVQLLNAETGDWDEITDSPFTVDHYVDNQNIARLRIDAPNDYVEATLPVLVLRSEVQ